MTAVLAPGIPRARHAGLERTSVRIGHTDPGDDYVEVTAGCLVMSTSAFLDAVRLRELAADLVTRADLIDPGGIESAHQQVGRADGTWGCRCGWVQDKPHREHVADMVAAAAATPPTTAAPSAETGA